MLRKFGLENVKEVSVPMGQHYNISMDQRPKSDAKAAEMQKIPYASIISSAMYAMISTRPDIAQAVSATSRYMSNHRKEHWLALRWLMKYQKGASNIGILFDGAKECTDDALMGWSDSDYAGNIDTRRSQSVYIFTLYGAAISWKSSLQAVVALSTTEAEFMALAATVKESFWLRGILKDFG
ncbi:secreted RxLR effector protein 161-like [Salvia splendens]|uniref:secreted RxLR effector protein 161-like n=1 Tax=Salvia splendens TaxID=180675 RepID=UPI001C28021D|nr:secreted RxLR effector protein 161-like [Salvia splendens]